MSFRFRLSLFRTACCFAGRGLAFAAVLAAPSIAHSHPKATGEKIYQEMCANCHGAKGEGVAGKHDEPIYGEKSLEALTKYIDRAMPEDKADTLDAKGSAEVAAYIYEAFYSPTARARLHPEKRVATRLTNRQFQESVADAIASLQEPKPRGEAKGLLGEYFQSDRMNKKSRKGLEWVDAALDFNFGEVGPAEGIAKDQFCIAWDGSLLPEETGWHEFRVRTPNGARLYVNTDLLRGEGNFRDDSGSKTVEPTIDAWVSSGAEIRESSARVFLLGGRSYPLRFDYFKYKDKRGSVKLEWRQPDGQWQVLAAPHLSPEPSLPVTTVTVSFPADDGSVGYERGVSVSKEWHEATTKAALEAANHVVARLNKLTKTDEKSPDRADKAKQMLAQLAERAFRRPLADDLRQLYVGTHFADNTSVGFAVKRSVLQILKSPRFLYPELGEKQDDFATASRMALILWDSLPDAALFESAKRGELKSKDQLRAHTERMLKDARARTKLNGFFNRWLAGEAKDHMDKDKNTYPGFDGYLVMDMQRSLQLFVEHVVWSDASDYRELLLADYLFLNPRLAKYYGVQPPEKEEFVPVKFDPTQRAGIFTHPLLLTAFSYHKSTSPIHRGVFLTRNVLGRFLKPPPMAIEFMDDRFDPSLTMREKVTQLTSKSACMGCHATINPLGFSLENYDATGRYRTTDNQKPVNAASEYVGSDGETLQLSGPRDLAVHAANNREARRGFVRQVFQFLVKQAPSSFAPETLERLEKEFSAQNCNIQKLVAQIVLAAALPTAQPQTASHP